MPRPRKIKRICSLPEFVEFGPLTLQNKPEEAVRMFFDEYQTIRHIDYEGLTQEECALRMGVARTTVQAIYAQARYKLAKMLSDGTPIIINGGDYCLCEECEVGCMCPKDCSCRMSCRQK